MGDDPIPISALQHAVYCLRQAALIHIERLWEENRFTAEGRVLHARPMSPPSRYSRGVRRVTAMPLASRRLGLSGIADSSSSTPGDGETAYPVEFKRGKPKPHRADEVQFCAQAFCLEEMTGHAGARGRIVLRRDTPPRRCPLRRRPAAAHRERRRGSWALFLPPARTPPAECARTQCPACSLIDLCRPQNVGRSASLARRQARAALAFDPQRTSREKAP